MCIPCVRPFFVPMSRSHVKVKYQGHILKEMVVMGGLMFQKHSLFETMDSTSARYPVPMGMLLGIFKANF